MSISSFPGLVHIKIYETEGKNAILNVIHEYVPQILSLDLRQYRGFLVKTLYLAG